MGQHMFHRYPILIWNLVQQLKYSTLSLLFRANVLYTDASKELLLACDHETIYI